MKEIRGVIIRMLFSILIIIFIFIFIFIFISFLLLFYFYFYFYFHSSFYFYYYFHIYYHYYFFHFYLICFYYFYCSVDFSFLIFLIILIVFFLFTIFCSLTMRLRNILSDPDIALDSPKLITLISTWLQLFTPLSRLAIFIPSICPALSSILYFKLSCLVLSYFILPIFDSIPNLILLILLFVLSCLFLSYFLLFSLIFTHLVNFCNSHIQVIF